MSDYLQIEFRDILPEQAELLIAHLNEIGFDGFEETETGLKAFIKSAEFNKATFEESVGRFQIPFVESVIPETNWNRIWESSFEPVVVNDFVAVRADFHAPIREVKFEIIITPKMSFGTGHHATTYMMLENMNEIDFAGKTVLDFGTGTAVLAILAEKLGAKKILAIDNDRWSIENATENILRNNCKAIELRLSGSNDGGQTDRFDIILANINRNIILENLGVLKRQLSLNGTIMLSGLLATDEEAVAAACEHHKLSVKFKSVLRNWLFFSVSHI